MKTKKTKKTRKIDKSLNRIIRTLKKNPEWRARTKSALKEIIKELQKNKNMPNAQRYIRNIKAMLMVIREIDRER